MTAPVSDPREPRYRRILRLLPRGGPAGRADEVIAVLLAAHDDRRRSGAAETLALLGYVGRTWLRALGERSLSPDPSTNRRAAALLTVLLPLILLFPVARTAVSVATEPWSFLVFNRDDLGVWAVWGLAALATVAGPAWLPRWLALAGTGWFAVLTGLAIVDGRTGFVSTGFAYLLVQLAASGLLWDPDRLRAGRALLRAHLVWVAGLLTGVFVLFALPFAVGTIGPVTLSPLLLTLSLVTLTVVGLGDPTGRALVTAGLPLFAAFVAGHGWWIGISGVDFFYPFTNAPGWAEMVWLLVLPVGTWLAVRTLGGLLAQRDRRTT